MINFLFVLQIIISIVLTSLIMLQVKGTGFGRVWGGLSVSSSRRGLEGLVFKATFLFCFAFLLISLSILLI